MLRFIHPLRVLNISPQWPHRLESLMHECERVIKQAQHSSCENERLLQDELHRVQVESRDILNSTKAQQLETVARLQEEIQAHFDRQTTRLTDQVDKLVNEEELETRKGFLKRIDDIARETETLQTQRPHAQQVADMSNVKFPSYSGKQSEDIVKWKKALNRNFDFLEWDQHRRARYIPTLLSDKALRYYESLPETTTRNYKSCVRRT